MAINQLDINVDQPDPAGLTVGGVSYKCFIWWDTDNDTVEALVMAEGEGGQLLAAHYETIATAVVANLDCPRVLACNGLFVAHWIDYGGAPAIHNLHRALFDPTNMAAGWSAQGSVSIWTANQYDHTEITGDATGFIVARRTLAGTIASARYESPYSWVDTTWSQNDAGLTIADTVLAVHADATDDTMMVCYQDTLTLQAYRRVASSGVDFAGPNEVFADLDSGDNFFTAVGITCPAANSFLIVAEALDDADNTAGSTRGYARMVGWRVVRTSNAGPLHESQWAYNLHLVSKPWTWVSGLSLTNDAYVAVGWKSITDGQEYDQSNVYVVRLDYPGIADANASGVMRPIPVSALMAGSADARPHAFSPVATPIGIGIGKRLNHLSQAVGPPSYDLGPNVTSVLFALIKFSRLVGPSLEPAQAGVGYVRFFHEDPWHIRRDDKQPTQPDTPAWVGTAPTMCRPLEINGGLVLSGGVTQAYDGQQAVELGFLHTPEITEINPVGAGGGMDVAGTYFWYVNFAWVDHRGQLHRSGPSRPLPAPIVVNGFATMDVRPCALSMKDDLVRYPTAGVINIEVWRTYVNAGGTAFVTSGTGANESYLFRREYGGDLANFQIQDTPQSDNSDFTVQFNVGKSNAALRGDELSPFQLNLETLQWSPPPPTPHRPLGIAAVWQNRLFGVDPETPEVIHFSEPILPLGTQYEWPYFLDTNTYRFDGNGKITALQPMDNLMVIFTRTAIYSLSGDPGAGGSGAQFTIDVVARGLGCIDERSVVLSTEGIFFQSEKGIHRLSRGLNLDYPGSPVEDIVRDAGNIRSAVHLENRHQVRFTYQALPGTGPLDVRPRVLTFDYQHGSWATRSIPALAQTSTTSRLNEMQDATAWRGLQGEVLHVVLQQGGLAIERSNDDTVYADEGAAGTTSINLDITTEWIHLAGIDGLKRVRELGIQTERINDGGMQVDLYYDVDGSYDETLTDHYEWASPAPDYLPIQPRIQRVRAFRMRIRELTPPTTENVRLVTLLIHYQPKPTPGRYARANRGT